MAGALCAIAGVFAQTTLSYITLSLTSFYTSLNYDAIEIGGALVTIVLGMAVLVFIRAKAQLRQQRYAAYSALVIGLAALQVVLTVVELLRVSGDMAGVWLPMILVHLLVLGLALLTYFVVRGLSRADRIFRAVLTIMVAMMVTLSASAIVSMIAQFGGISMERIDTVYTVVGIAAPLLVYAAAVWAVRPVKLQPARVKAGK